MWSYLISIRTRQIVYCKKNAHGPRLWIPLARKSREHQRSRKRPAFVGPDGLHSRACKPTSLGLPTTAHCPGPDHIIDTGLSSPRSPWSRTHPDMAGALSMLDFAYRIHKQTERGLCENIYVLWDCGSVSTLLFACKARKIALLSYCWVPGVGRSPPRCLYIEFTRSKNTPSCKLVKRHPIFNSPNHKSQTRDPKMKSASAWRNVWGSPCLSDPDNTEIPHDTDLLTAALYLCCVERQLLRSAHSCSIPLLCRGGDVRSAHGCSIPLLCRGGDA